MFNLVMLSCLNFSLSIFSNTYWVPRIQDELVIPELERLEFVDLMTWHCEEKNNVLML